MFGIEGEAQNSKDKSTMNTSSLSPPPLHTLKVLPSALFNRIFALVYTCGIISLFFHHFLTLFHSTTTNTIFLHLTFILSDVVLAFMWATTQSFRMRPVTRHVHPENLAKVVPNDRDYPKLDVFICTADPYKEPPMGVVNTALSVMAYDYPPDKISVYVSDDGGSMLTLFAFFEASKFATHWLPYCKKNMIEDRSPEVHFSSVHASKSAEVDQLKIMYETMKMKVESAVERGSVVDEYIKTDVERQAFNKWTAGFSRQDHPTVIQVLLESDKDKDIMGHDMPNLVYVSREKSKTSSHHFKGGALNVLLRVSASMTNAPVVLTLDCDMYSNDPRTPIYMLCFLLDTKTSRYAYLQFPQRFHGINKNDIYGGENKRLYQINPIGMDGLAGTNYVGSGTFFRRQAFLGGPSSFISAEIPESNSEHVLDKSIQCEAVLKQAHTFASCDYERGTKWGSEMGFRYGSLVEDFYTGYQMHCQGWNSIFFHPKRAAFLGDIPINLYDVLSQNKRWAVGSLEVAFCEFSPITHGIKSRGVLMGLAYSYFAFWAIWSIPITIYSLALPLDIFKQMKIFPKVCDPWFYLYVFLFLGSYIQDCLDFVLLGGTIRQWWCDQRMWSIRGLSSYLFGTIDFTLQSLHISTFGFNITSKVIDSDQSKRYKQGIFEFGVASPLFIPLTLAAIINLISFSIGLTRVILGYVSMEETFVKLFMSGFVIVNAWPVYEAIAFRSDKGRMPLKTTMVSTFVALLLFLVVFFTC